MRMARGRCRQPAHPRRHRSDPPACSPRSTGACRAAPRGCAWCARRAAGPKSAGMRFEDEPVPGYPLPILPGHTSPGRFERVLRAGAVRGHRGTRAARLRRSRGRLPARAHLRWLRRCHQRDRRLWRELPHVEPRGLRAPHPRRLRAGHADLLPRQEPHRHPGRHPGRCGDGRVQHPVPDRRWRAGRRPPAGAAGVRPRLDVAARDGTHAARRAPLPLGAARYLRAARAARGGREPLRARRWTGAHSGSPRRSPPAHSSSRPSTVTTCRCCRSSCARSRTLGLLEKVFILVGVGPLRSAKAADWMRAHVPGVHIPDAVIERLAGAADGRSRDAGSASR